MISLADIYPTILDMAGLDMAGLDIAGAAAPANIHGRSLLPLIDDAASDWRDHVGIEFGGVNNLAATLRTMVKDGFKYGYSAGFPDQLYDLNADPYETTNLVDAAQHRERLRDLRQTMSAWMEEHNDPARGIYNRGLQYHLSCYSRGIA